MTTKIVAAITGFILFIITHLSYLGLIFLMAIESANIPLPSELIMPFAGFLVYQGKMNIHLAAFAGATGCVIGSVVSYYLGYYGGRPFLEKYGKYILLTRHDLDLGERLFAKHGDKIAFISRILPIIRTFISFPAGVVKMNIKKFLIYSFVGSLLWSYLLVFIGEKIGSHQDVIAAYFHKFDVLIGVILVFAVVAYIYRHVKQLRG